MRFVLAILAGGISAGLTTVLWTFFGKHVPPTLVPAAFGSGGAMLVLNLLRDKKAGAEDRPR
jgi:hypothetical protein